MKQARPNNNGVPHAKPPSRKGCTADSPGPEGKGVSVLGGFAAWRENVVTASPLSFASAALASAALLAAAVIGGCADDDGRLPEARRGDLEVILELRGNLQAGEAATIKTQRWGEIRWMAPNGSAVKAGQTVLELADDDIQQWVRDGRANVELRAAEMRQAEQEVAKALRGAQMDLAAAKLERELAEAKLKELLAKPTERELADASAQVELSKALVVASGEALVLIKDLVAAGYAPEDDRRTAEVDLLAARADQAGAEARLQTVRLGPTAFERQEAETLVAAAGLAEQSAAKNIEVNKEMGEVRMARCARRLERDKEKLAENERHLSETSSKSPVDGVVLYAPRPWGGGFWQVGLQPWQGATIMTVPNFSQMKVRIQVPAERVGEIENRKDLPARVRTPALPGRVFPARLTKVSIVGRDEFDSLDPATSEKLGRAERQVFEAEVILDENDPRLRPGLGAAVQIVLRRVTGAIVVPLTVLERPKSVASEERSGNGLRRPSAEAVLRVRTAKGVEERTVRVLARGEFEAAVEGAVQPGDRLLPARPPVPESKESKDRKEAKK
jgi:hypothetical protein